MIDGEGRARRLFQVSPDSGPAVARLFHAALGLVFVIAFASLRVQVEPLFGADGLAPIAEAVTGARGDGWLATPTLFWWWHGDALLRGAATLGALAGVLALAGVWPRVCLAAATLLYLSFVSVGAPFLQFQWDSLLVECGVLALLLPRDRPSQAAHLLVVFALFKLYFESGLAKWWSPIGDWRDGSAMSYYYETAPLPGPLAWYAHHLPEWWHQLESWAALAIELIAPVLMFCGRSGRLVALVALTGLQALNLATANYGFFVWLTLMLHLFLLGDADLLRLYARLPGQARWGRVLLPPAEARPRRWVRARASLLAGFAAAYVGLSLVTARVELGGEAGRWATARLAATSPRCTCSTLIICSRRSPGCASSRSSRVSPAARGDRTTSTTSQVRQTGRRPWSRRTSRASTSCCGSTGSALAGPRPGTSTGC